MAQRPLNADITTAPLRPQRLLLALLAAGALGGAAVSFVASHGAHAAATPGTATNAANATGSPAATVGGMVAPDFAAIATRHGAAVVNISVTGVRQAAADDEETAASGRGGPSGMDPQDPMLEFFRRSQGRGGSAPPAQNQLVRGQGSGFIVSPDGLILTNAHVVRGATEMMVKLNDHREFPAKVLGADAKTDVAVLRIDAKNLPVLPLGSTRDLRVGEWVLAIGSPFGFENSVSAGVVSAKGRSLPDDSFVPFIQTDVAVNPGNSGGPLFNARGEVVGINSQIYSRTGGYQGLSFAIPIEVANKVKEQIVATGRASHARLGVAIQDVNQALADSFKLDKPEGALVSAVDPDGPAAQAGLLPGDVIRRIDGQAIVASGDLPALIGQSLPSQKINIDIWRQGQARQLSAQLADASDKNIAKADKTDAAAKGRLGLALRPQQPQEQRQAAMAGGKVIEQVSGAAARAGVLAGDLLIAVNGQPVNGVEQVRAAVARDDKSVALLIQRDGQQIFVPVRLG